MWKLKSILALFLVLGLKLSLIDCQNVIPPEMQTKIDALIEDVMTGQNVPGFGLSVTKGDGEIVYNKGYGFADVENQVPAGNTTLFAIGSITKSFTATIVVKTLSEMFPAMGVNALITPIRTLVPSYNFTMQDRYRSEKTTFRDLLAHRVCTLPEGVGMWVKSYEDSDDILYRQRYAPEYCNFRDSFVYNNGLIAMAGDIIAHLANSTYNDMLQTLLDDIGMSGTTWVKESDDHNNMSGRSVPYIWRDNQLIRFNPELLKGVVNVNAAGGVLSNANDMMKYMQLHLNKGRVGDQQVVSEEAMSWLQILSNPTAAGVAKTEMDPNARVDFTMGYALCLSVGIYDGWLKVGHGGFLPPFESLMEFYPDLNLGIFITMNGPGSLYYTSQPQNILLNDIFDAVQGNEPITTGAVNRVNSTDLYSGPYHIRPNKVASDLSNPKAKTNLRLEPEEVIGTFGSGLNGEIDIRMRENDFGVDQPFMEFGQLGHGWLRQTSATTFSVNWTTDFWMMAWSNQIGELHTTLSFLDVDTFQMLDNGTQSSTDFHRDLKVGDLPEIPWAPDSCGEQ